ncbi:MAG: hypothetical protein A2007_00875 [Verrucomicrobia bacterium GWC2_42_7]|nr:MAG: hypothetical protein A2007_00875 [Verrucomicrobia bacterium GWC2_42_7]
MCISYTSFLYAGKDDEAGTSDAPPKPTPEVWENFQNADFTLGILINIFDFLEENDQGRLARVNRTLRAAALKRRQLVEYLDLSNSGLTDKQLPFIVQQHPNLKILFLSYCQTLTDEGLAVLGQLHRLEEINLSNTELKDKSLIEMANGCPNLIKCDYSRTKITSKGLIVLGFRCKNITSLEVKCGRMTHSSFIPQRFPNLTTLPNFSSNILIPNLEKTDMAVATAEKHKLLEADLSCLTSITDADLSAFTECPIRSLKLCKNHNLTARGIAQAISKMLTLEIMELVELDQLTPNDITEIIRSAPSSLKHLLVHDYLRDWGSPTIQSFCQTLVQYFPNLESINLIIGEGSHLSTETLVTLGQLKELKMLRISGIVESAEVDLKKRLADLFKCFPKLISWEATLSLADGSIQAPEETLQVITENRPNVLSLSLGNIRYLQSITSWISQLHELKILYLDLSPETRAKGEEILPVLAENCRGLSYLYLKNVTLYQQDISALNQMKKIKSITIGQLDYLVDLSPLNRLRLDMFFVQDSENLSAADIERFCSQLKNRGLLFFNNSSLTWEEIQAISDRYHVVIATIIQ